MTKSRPWFVTALAVLLLIQGFLLVNLGSFKLYQTFQPTRFDLADMFFNVSTTSTAGLTSIPLAFLAVLAAAGLFRLWPIAWINAMSVQGMVLLVLLLFHFSGNISGAPDYLTMAYSVLIVLYLNYGPVRRTFRPTYLVEEGEAV